MKSELQQLVTDFSKFLQEEVDLTGMEYAGKESFDNFKSYHLLKQSPPVVAKPTPMPQQPADFSSLKNFMRVGSSSSDLTQVIFLCLDDSSPWRTFYEKIAEALKTHGVKSTIQNKIDTSLSKTLFIYPDAEHPPFLPFRKENLFILPLPNIYEECILPVNKRKLWRTLCALFSIPHR